MELARQFCGNCHMSCSFPLRFCLVVYPGCYCVRILPSFAACSGSCRRSQRTLLFVAQGRMLCTFPLPYQVPASLWLFICFTSCQILTHWIYLELFTLFPPDSRSNLTLALILTLITFLCSSSASCRLPSSPPPKTLAICCTSVMSCVTYISFRWFACMPWVVLGFFEHVAGKGKEFYNWCTCRIRTAVFSRECMKIPGNGTLHTWVEWSRYWWESGREAYHTCLTKPAVSTFHRQKFRSLACAQWNVPQSSRAGCLEQRWDIKLPRQSHLPWVKPKPKDDNYCLSPCVCVEGKIMELIFE